MDILVARTKADLDVAYDRLSGAPCLGCDTETSGLVARTGRLYSVQFSDGDFGVLVPVSEGASLGRLGELFSNDAVVKVFHNAKFDLDFLQTAGLEVNNVFDTMIAEKVLTRGANQSASLADTLYRYFAVDLDKSLRSRFHKKWNGIWTDELVDYALSDVAHLPRLMAEQTAWLNKLGLSEEFWNQMDKVAVSIAGT